MAALSRRERWLIGAGVAIAVALGAWAYVVEPALDAGQQIADLIPAREATLERRRELSTRGPALSAEMEAVDKALAKESERLLAGPTPPLAASELQRLVKDVAVSVGAEIRSERVLAPADRGGLQEIPVEITVAGGIREAVNLLYQLEQTGKLLSLQDLKMRVISVGQPRDLLTTLTVAGYILPAAPVKANGRPPAPAGN